MSCTVTLRDSRLYAVRSARIDIIAFDHAAGIKLHTIANGSLGGSGYGTKLPTTSGAIFDIIVDTTATSYGPPTLQTFTDTGTSRTIDIILYTLSSSGSSGAAPTNAADVTAFILRQQWTDTEKRAAFVTLSTLRYIKRAPPAAFGGMEDRLGGMVRSLLGINPALIT